tara:strand:+ start:8487 stop:11375 length:2889 start_codon:yes stop_codon:yes gene_type:complete
MMQSVAADPPPGQPDVTNDICSTWNSANGICDDYDSSLDLTPGSEWIASSVEVDVADAEMVEMRVNLAVHEMSRADLELSDLDLEGDSSPWHGIPADYIRNYESLARSGGNSVSDLMLERVEQIMEEFIDINFPNANTTTITTVSEVDFKSQTDAQCVYDSDYDSIDEVNGYENDPFQPPICFQAVLQMQVDTAAFGLKPETSDINRMMQGMLIMGASLNSQFNATSPMGHWLELSVMPPEYATVESVENPGFILSRSVDGQPQTYSIVTVDNTQAVTDAAIQSVALKSKLIHRSTTTPTYSFNQRDPSLRINLDVDASNPQNSQFKLEIAIHHLDSDTLSEWNANLHDGTIEIPWISSDGIRLLNQEVNEDLSALLDGIPVEEMSTAFSEALGAEIWFNTPQFSEADENGGLGFQHTPGATCDESLQVRYCIEGESAMSGDWPVILETSSQSTPMRVASVIERILENTGGEIATIDLSKVTDEDLASLMSVLEVEMEADTSWLHNLLPEGMPRTELTLTLHLPEWIESTIGDPSMIEIVTSASGEEQNFAFKGTRSFDWRHPICIDSDPCEEDSPDLICGANQMTCISFDIVVDIEKFTIRETSFAAEVEFSADVVLEIYRLGIELDEEGIELSPVPSDLLRRGIVIGDRIDGGLLAGSDLEAPIDLGVGDPIMLQISNQGLQNTGDELTMRSGEIIESYGGIETVQDFGMGPYTIRGEFDDTPLVAIFDTITMPTDSEAGDTIPMRLSFEVKSTIVSAKLRGEEISISAQPASIGLSISRQILAAFGHPVANSSGIHVEGLEFFLEVTPLMEHTVFGTIRSSARMEIHLPTSVRLLTFESREGLGELLEQDGRQVVVYRTPICPDATTWAQCSENKDIVSYSIEVSWAFVIGELAPYIFILLFAAGLLISRRRRLKREREEKKLEESSAEQQKKTELAMESEFGKLEDGTTVVDESFFED